jgi:hypothetical protein
LFQAGVHLVLFNELTPVGLGNALPHGGTKSYIFLKQTQGGILHEPLGDGAFLAGDLRKLRFLLGREMSFLAFTLPKRLVSGKRTAIALR